MDMFYRIVSMLGGLALFLYGMRIMGDGLKSSSGGALKAVLAKVTDKPVKGFLLGMLVTCMIQSSTATIVLTVGLVGAGFLNFRQSIGIVLGANVGTAITAQIIRLMDVQAGSGSILYFFKSDNLAPMALIIGIVMIMFVHTKASGTIGTICMGFGILFVGLMNMSSAVGAMGDSLSGLLTSFEGNYFLGFLSGVLVTGVIQSSSAVVGIIQSVASSVGVKFCAIFAVIVGVNIGDCLTTFLVCRLGAKSEQIRTTVVHIIYNVCAAVLVFTVVGIGRATGLIGDGIWLATMRSGGVANVHGLFRLVPAVVLLPFSGLFANLAEKIVPDKAEENEDSEYEQYLRELDMRLIQNPRLALDESEELIGHMAEVAIHNYDAAITQIFAFEEAREARIDQRENLLDRMADASNKYIVAISPYITLEADHRNQSFQYKALTCFERIGDLAVNIRENMKSLRDSGEGFSDFAVAELKVISGAVGDILSLTSEAYQKNSIALAKKVEPLEEVIDELIVKMRDKHTHRMVKGQCSVFSGIAFQNVLTNLERVSDQCSDLAVYLLGRSDDRINGREHLYIENLHHSKDPEYQREFAENYEKYFDRLDEVIGEIPEKQETKKQETKKQETKKPEKK